MTPDQPRKAPASLNTRAQHMGMKAPYLELSSRLLLNLHQTKIPEDKHCLC